MIEEWKCIKEYNGTTAKAGLHCTGDKIYVSNTGRVRLNDIELTLDRGLYIDANYEIHIVGTSWPYNNMHRTIYELFIGGLKKGSQWNIHHIDFNHYNNNVDNLIQLSSFEHASIHKEADETWGFSKTYEWEEQQYKKQDEVIRLTKEWLKQRIVDYLKADRKAKKEKHELYKQQKQLQKQQEIEAKLASGKYKYYNGHLRPTTTKKKGYIMPQEYKNKISAGVKQAWVDGKLTADKCKAKYK